MTGAESPDGAVFAAPQDPTSPSPSIAWVIDGNGPAQIAEHIPTGIAALAADGTNFYVATYSTLTAWIYQQQILDGETVRHLADAWRQNLETAIGERDTDTVYRRSFSALMLSVVVARDNATPFLPAAPLGPAKPTGPDGPAGPAAPGAPPSPLSPPSWHDGSPASGSARCAGEVVAHGVMAEGEQGGGDGSCDAAAM